MKKFARFMEDESGATAIEYALLAGLIGVVIVGAATTAGTYASSIFQKVSDVLQTVAGS